MYGRYLDLLVLSLIGIILLSIYRVGWKQIGRTYFSLESGPKTQYMQCVTLNYIDVLQCYNN